jgi:hypothetical protein
MWDWGWSATNQNPLTSQWFGIPWNNYFGWLVVIFTYSAFSRLFARWRIKILIPFTSIVLSEIILFGLFNNIKPWMLDHLGITPLDWLIGMVVLLIGLMLFGWKKRQPEISPLVPFPAWLIPAWFHIYFTLWFFISGFYRENKWMTFFALTNLLLAVVIHKPATASDKLLKKEVG